MALNININLVAPIATIPANTKVADIVVTGGTAPYNYTLATGSDSFSIDGTTVKTKAEMTTANIASFSVLATDSASPADTVTSDVTYPAIESALALKMTKANIIYKITRYYDLGHATLTIPAGCTLDFQGGSLNNGTVILNNTLLVCNSTRVLNCLVKGTCRNESLNVEHLTYGYSHILAVNYGGVVNLLSNINTPVSINLKCDINGYNHTINYTGNSTILLNFTTSNITIKDVVLSIDTDQGDAFCYSIYGVNCLGITLEGCSILNGSIRFLNDTTNPLLFFTFKNCKINVDHTKTTQDSDIQHDAITLRGIQNVTIEGCEINCKNVNRVFKISSGSQGLYCDKISLYNNIIISDSVNGKQVFDMYGFTKNVTIEDNIIKATNHTSIFENKTTEDNTDLNTINICNNTIYYDWTLMYYNINQANSYMTLFNNNIISTSDQMTRTIIEGGQTTTLNRTAGDLDIRSIKVVKIDSNTFKGTGLVTSRLIAISGVIECNIINNTIFQNWNNVAVFSTIIDDINVIGNNEIIDVTNTLTEPFIYLYCTDNKNTNIINNKTYNRSRFLAQSIASFKGVNLVIRGNTVPNKLFNFLGTIESMNIDGSLIAVIDIPSTTIAANSTATITVSTGSTDKSMLTYYIKDVYIPCAIEDIPNNSGLKLTFINGLANEVTVNGSLLIIHGEHNSIPVNYGSNI